jgi:hypothetical protein
MGWFLYLEWAFSGGVSGHRGLAGLFVARETRDLDRIPDGQYLDGLTGRSGFNEGGTSDLYLFIL